MLKKYSLFLAIVFLLVACASPMPIQSSVTATSTVQTPSITVTPSLTATATETPTPTPTFTPSPTPTPTAFWNDTTYNWEAIHSYASNGNTTLEMQYVVDNCLSIVLEWTEKEEKKIIDQLMCSYFYTDTKSDRFYSLLAYNILRFKSMLTVFNQLPSFTPQWLQEHTTSLHDYRYVLFFVRSSDPTARFFWATQSETVAQEFYWEPAAICCFNAEKWKPRVYIPSEGSVFYALNEFEPASRKGYKFLSATVLAENAQVQRDNNMFIVYENSSEVAFINLEQALNGYTIEELYTLQRGNQVIGYGNYNTFEVVASSWSK